MDKDRSPLLEELEKAKAEELAKLGNVPTTGSPLLNELDEARADEEVDQVLNRIKSEEYCDED